MPKLILLTLLASVILPLRVFAIDLHKSAECYKGSSFASYTTEHAVVPAPVKGFGKSGVFVFTPENIFYCATTSDSSALEIKGSKTDYITFVQRPSAGVKALQTIGIQPPYPGGAQIAIADESQFNAGTQEGLPALQKSAFPSAKCKAQRDEKSEALMKDVLKTYIDGLGFMAKHWPVVGSELTSEEEFKKRLLKRLEACQGIPEVADTYEATLAVLTSSKQKGGGNSIKSKSAD